MSLSLLDLPTEILNLIFHESSLEGDVLSLVRASCCCKFLRKLLVPLIFRQVTFTSDELSCKSALMAIIAYSQYMKSMYFTGNTLPIGWETELHPLWSQDPLERQMIGVPSKVLPEAARDILSGKGTPSVTSLTIKYDLLMVAGFSHRHYKEPGVDELPEGHLMWQDLWELDREQFRSTESDALWLARIDAIWRSISANRRLTRLRVRNFIPRSTSVILEPTWNDFVNQLEHLEIAVPPTRFEGEYSRPKLAYEDGSATGEGNPRQQWMSFTSAKNLRYLELRGSPVADLSRSLHYLLIRRPENMPHLARLSLHYIWLDSRLGVWLSHHARVLRSLELYNCWFRDKRFIYSNPPLWGWKTIFRPYTDADAGPNGPVALERVVIWAGDCKEPSSHIPLYTPKADEWPWHVDTAQRDGNRHELPYGGPFNLRGKRTGPPFSFLYGEDQVDLRDSLGGWGSHIDPRTTLDAYEKQEDWREYRRLLELVKRNTIRPSILESTGP